MSATDLTKAVILGFEFYLLGDGGLWWPDQRVLFVADLHLGKEATFRSGGIAIPRGATEATLDRISRMLNRCQVDRLIILGDLFHARSSLASDVQGSLDAFRGRHEGTQLTLVKGNHDASTGALPPRWRIEIIASQSQCAGITLSHYPGLPLPSSPICLAGHLHPAMRICDNLGPTGKLPCFYFDHQARCMILPAAGRLTGTAVVHPRRGDRAWVIADGETIEMPVKACGSR
jgi:DNA ligase-associated metallophosphoesterase